MRVGVLRGGLELESEKSIPPSQRLEIVRGQALAQLRNEASNKSARREERTDFADGEWRDLRGLPSPPLSSSGGPGSDDEISSASKTEDCEGLNLTRK